jgi:superfamily I DNA and/or RNA helicase
MAPLIRHFPSRRFYQNRLIDAASVTSRACPPFLEGFANRNVAFLDVKFGRELLRGSSYMNELEGKVIGTLVKCLLCLDISMGIITPYQAQRKVISRECIQELHTL